MSKTFSIPFHQIYIKCCSFKVIIVGLWWAKSHPPENYSQSFPHLVPGYIMPPVLTPAIPLSCLHHCTQPPTVQISVFISSTRLYVLTFSLPCIVSNIKYFINTGWIKKKKNEPCCQDLRHFIILGSIFQTM